MKIKFILVILLSVVLSGCVGVSSKGLFGTGVSVAFDPRTVGTQMDDSIMQKNLAARILIQDKKHLLSVKSKVLDGRIFLTGKVDIPEEAKLFGPADCCKQNLVYLRSLGIVNPQTAQADAAHSAYCGRFDGSESKHASPVSCLATMFRCVGAWEMWG